MISGESAYMKTIISLHSAQENHSLSRYARFCNLSSGIVAVATAFFLPLSTSIMDALFIVCPILFLLGGQYKEKLTFLWERRAIFLCAVLFLWMLIGISYSQVPLKESWLGLTKYDKLLFGVFFAPIFREEKWRRYALQAFFLAILVTLAAALLKETGFVHREKFTRFLVFKDRIQTSFLMALSACFALVLYFEQSNKAARNIYALLFLFSVCFLFSIDGRSGYVIFCILFTWLSWNRRGWRGLVYALSVLVITLALAYLFSPGFKGRIQESNHDISTFQSGQENTSLGLRAEFVKNSVPLIEQHPIFGAGTGSFNSRYTSLSIPDYLHTNNPHNQYVYVWVQWGVVGLILLLGVFFVQWWDSYLLPNTLRQIAQCVIISIAIGSLANSWLSDTTEGHFYVYFIALTFASQMTPRTLFSMKNSSTP